VILSILDPTSKNNPKAIVYDKGMFRITPGMTAMILIILGILGALYIRFW
jgi:SSS family solute:Na+ symporter